MGRDLDLDSVVTYHVFSSFYEEGKDNLGRPDLSRQRIGIIRGGSKCPNPPERAQKKKHWGKLIEREWCR